MNSIHFENQLSRLIGMYGEKHFPKERSKRIWAIVKDLPDEWMTRTVDHFIDYEQYAPLRSKWDEAISKERERMHEQTKRAPIVMTRVLGDYNCSICSGEGIYLEKEYGGMTVCECMGHRFKNTKR